MGQAAEVEGSSQRDAMVAMCRLLVLTTGLSGSSPFPQEMLAELDRAAKGDASVDVEALALRLNACVAGERVADLSKVSFEGGKTAQGRRFKVAVPDGWTVVEDYLDLEPSAGACRRPFVIVQGEAAPDADLSRRDRISYVAGEDADFSQGDRTPWFDDVLWARRWVGAYSSDGEAGCAGPAVIWDTEVEAANTRCLVAQREMAKGPNGLVFDVYPYAADHLDCLRFSFAYSEVTDVEAALSLVLAMARSVELDKPVVPWCEEMLARALRGKVPAGDFADMADDYAGMYVAMRRSVCAAAQCKYQVATDVFDEARCRLAGARGVAETCGRAVPKFQKLLDAYDVQVAGGSSAGERAELLEALGRFDSLAFPTADIFGDDARLVEEAGVLGPSEELVALRGCLEQARQRHGELLSLDGAPLDEGLDLADSADGPAAEFGSADTCEQGREDAVPAGPAGEFVPDPDLADKVAWCLIFDRGVKTAEWVCEMLPELSDQAQAGAYLAYLAVEGVLIAKGDGQYKARMTFTDYMCSKFDAPQRELDREAAYEALLLVLADYGDYAKLDELMISVEGLPARDEVRSLLLMGVERGDLERKGRSLSFRFTMDADRAAAWRQGAAERRARREEEAKVLASRRKACGPKGSERQAAREQYLAWVDARQAAEATAREAQRVADRADAKLIVEKLEAYRLGTGYVDANWALDAAPSTKTVKRAQELLDAAWEAGEIRRVARNGGWVYAKLIPAEEWEERRAQLKQELDADVKAGVRDRGAGRGKAERDAYEDLARARDTLSYALRRIKTHEDELAEAAAEVERLDSEIAAKNSEIAGLEAELAAAGLFAFAKKSDLKERIEAARTAVDKLTLDRRRGKAEIGHARDDLEVAKKEGISREREKVAKAEGRLLPFLAAKVAKAWGAPVSAQWIAENVDGFGTADRVQELLATEQGKVAFTILESGLYSPR